jgi:effector-binding domain-containing protein
MTDLNLTDYRIVDMEPQPTIAVRIRKPMSALDMKQLFDTELPRVFQFATSQGHSPTGAPYARYFQFGPEEADIEIGLPVSEYPTEMARADAHFEQPGTSELPGGQVARVIHHGPYDTLGQAYDALHGWIHEHDHDEGTGPWESYVDDPTEVADEQDIRTEIFWPVNTIAPS